MTKMQPVTSALNAGEWSTLLEARPDNEEYSASARAMVNMVATVWGPAERRPGTRHIDHSKDDAPEIGVPFVFSTVQAYQLAAGDGYFRFYMDKAPIVVAPTDAAIANGDFTSGIAGWDDVSATGSSIAHDSTNGRLSLVAVGGAVAAAEQAVTVTATAVEHVLAFTVHGVAGDEIVLRIGTASEGDEILERRVCGVGAHTVPFTPGASPFYAQFRNSAGKTLQVDGVRLLDDEPLEIASPYAADEIAGIRWTQSADVLYLDHPDHAPRKLLRYGHADWSLVLVDHRDGPYLDENTSATTLTPSATTGKGITITASATDGINNGDGFKATDVGRLVTINHSATWGYARITGRSSATVVTADVRRDFGATTAQAAWRLGLWSDTDGHPRALAFHQERLVHGGAAARPQRLDLSASGDFENHAPGAADAADAIGYAPGANTVNPVLWIASGRGLFIGTPGGIGRIEADTAKAALTPDNIGCAFDIPWRAADLPPIAIGDVVLYVSQTGRKLYEIAYDLASDGYTAPDLTVRAEHITRGRIVAVGFQQEPWPVCWAVRADGVLLGFTYLRKEGVLAWHRHIVGGSFGDGAAVVESVSVIPGAETAIGDEVWLLVKRTVDGQTVRHWEVLEDRFEAPRLEDFDDDRDDFEAATRTAQADCWYLDAALKYDGAPATVFSGLEHLEGETVEILADGAAVPPQVVTGGQVTLTREASTVLVGLDAGWRLKLQRPVVQTRGGTTQGQNKRVADLSTFLIGTLGVSAGRGPGKQDVVAFRRTSDVLGAATPLFTGWKKIPFRGGRWDREGDMLLSGSGPYPAVIGSVVPTIDVPE